MKTTLGTRARRRGMLAITTIVMGGMLLLASACGATTATPQIPGTTAPIATATAQVMGTVMPTATATPGVVIVDPTGTTTVDPSALGTALGQLPTGTLTAAERDGLIYMREEEKLAGDVYLALYAQWNLPIFQNIARSEATHTAAVKTLLDRYGLDDPAAGRAAGTFTNATLQGLYDQLAKQGTQSLAAALRVGATIEDLDIIDLDLRLAQTDKTDITLVYENLKQGSRNHLRSFTSTLKTQAGESYQPQYLSQAAYDAIVNSPIEKGKGR